MKHLVFALSLPMLLWCGCHRAWYSFNNQRFNSPDDALQLHKRMDRETLAEITPLAKPVTTKTLIIGVPSESALETLNRDWNLTAGQNPNDTQLRYFVETDMEVSQFLVESTRKKNIYRSVETVETTVSGSLQPTADADVMYCFADPTRRVVQWYLANQKNGKQVLAHDASLPTPKERIDSQLNFIKAFALR